MSFLILCLLGLLSESFGLGFHECTGVCVIDEKQKWSRCRSDGLFLNTSMQEEFSSAHAQDDLEREPYSTIMNVKEVVLDMGQTTGCVRAERFRFEAKSIRRSCTTLLANHA